MTRTMNAQREFWNCISFANVFVHIFDSKISENQYQTLQTESSFYLSYGMIDCMISRMR